MKTDPLLKVGIFGTHLFITPTGSYAFFGSVPANLLNKSYPTYSEGIQSFVEWFLALSTQDQLEHVGNLRDDVFKLVFESRREV